MVRVLESKLAEVVADETFETEWKTFQDSIKLNGSYTVDEGRGTQGTALQDQKGTNLCVYFSITSALRQEMKRIVGNRKSVDIHSRNGLHEDAKQICIPKNKTIYEILGAEQCERMMSVLLGCVSPHALSDGGETFLTHSVAEGRLDDFQLSGRSRVRIS